MIIVACVLGGLALLVVIVVIVYCSMRSKTQADSLDRMEDKAGKSADTKDPSKLEVVTTKEDAL